jgi:protein O-mannosyl-transferase
MHSHLEIQTRRLPFLLIIFAILLSYGNSFRAGWHFDDRAHIRQNNAIQIKDFSSEAMLGVVYAAPRKQEDSPPRMFRPLASFTFALNWFLGEDDVFGYHLFNVILHIVSAFLLFEVIRSLYASPLLRRDREGMEVIALSAALLWALNPIQTQAVTYIVQRMTVMAALFFMMGMLLYIRGRLSKNRNTQLLCFIGVAVSYALALASKENAIMLPAVLFLVEFVFFL